QPIPGSAAIYASGATLYLHLQGSKCFLHYLKKSRSTQNLQLLLRIVEIINVDHLEAEVISAALDLVIQISRSETMAAGDDIVRLHHASIEVLVVDKVAISLFR